MSLIDVFQWTGDWARSELLKLWSATETTSTNSIAKDDEAELTKPALDPRSPQLHCSRPTLYLTRAQTSGRGRGDHVWVTPPGSALLSSWSFVMRSVPQPILSPLVGLALFEAARETWPGIAFNLKAPNDLYIGRQKTAGILIETVDTGIERRTVVGVGLNVSAKPAGLEIATCLQEHTEQAIQEAEWRGFLNAWLKRLSEAMTSGQSTTIPEQTATRLKDALNLHPLLKEPILHVDELGQLHSASRIVHWHEL